MRVIAGRLRGRRLATVRGRDVRPTSDKVKGALFSILGSRFDLTGARVLDLFAGSGALGIEALSRGAAQVTFVERSRAAAAVLRDNLAACKLTDESRLLQADVVTALRRLSTERQPFDVILLDPPYGTGAVAAALTQIAELGLLRPGGWLICEHRTDEPPATSYGEVQLTHTRCYGKTALALFTREAMGAEEKQSSGALRAVYAGSFDPITNGHLDLIRRGLQVFDQVIVAVAGVTSDAKKDRFLFTAEERVAMIREALADAGDRIVVDSFGSLLVDYCDRVGATVIIRGLRAVSDFEYEFQMAMMNRHLKPHIHTMFMATGETHSYTSSRLVKEVAALGGDVRGLVPEGVHRRLIAKLGPK